ncbi:MAG: aminodeoxychorismate/anthranilate synthase component II [Patescibacteria group bacterium]
MNTLIIDNYDSFTYILRQYVGELRGNPEVHFNDKISVAQIKKMKPTHIILSPGPGTVEHKRDVGVMFEVIEAFYKTIPILGVCLGHHAIGKYFGARIVRAPKIMHGKRSTIFHDHKGIFRNVRNPLEVMRYHSLILDTPFWMRSDDFTVTAYTSDFLIMGMEHNKYPVYGVQFHPESLGTQEGHLLLKNFLKRK